MKEIIENNYESTVKRGLITHTTTKIEFIKKIYEEYEELENHFFENEGEINVFELADIILVCLNMAKHYNIDIEYFLKKKIEINYKRSE